MLLVNGRRAGIIVQISSKDKNKNCLFILYGMSLIFAIWFLKYKEAILHRIMTLHIKMKMQNCLMRCKSINYHVKDMLIQL